MSTADPGGTGPDPMDAPPLRWGILAPGGIAETFATAVAEHTTSSVVAVGSRSLERATRFAARHGIPAAYGSYEELVADDRVQAVYVASPHSEHLRHALLAVAAGRHLLVEKALARNLREADELLNAASAAGVFAMEAMWTRHLPHIDWVRQQIASGAIGDIVHVRADHGQALDLPPDHRLKDPRLAGGALLDLGVYPVAFVLDLLGPPQQVQAIGRLTETGVDGQVALTLGYPGRVLAQAGTTLWTKTPTTATVSGTAGSIDIDGDFYRPTRARLRRADAQRTVAASFDGRVPGGFQYEIAEVARCVAAGRQQSERMSWAASRAVMRVLDEVRAQVGVVYPGE